MSKNVIIEKANLILEETKEEKEEYINERQIIFKLLEKSDEEENLIMLENIERIYEKYRMLEKYNNIEIILEEIKKQHIRKNDKDESVTQLFCVEDKNKKTYTFFSRKNARDYINANADKFDTTEINVIANNNVDLEILIKSLSD